MPLRSVMFIDRACMAVLNSLHGSLTEDPAFLHDANLLQEMQNLPLGRTIKMSIRKLVNARKEYQQKIGDGSADTVSEKAMLDSKILQARTEYYEVVGRLRDGYDFISCSSGISVLV